LTDSRTNEQIVAEAISDQQACGSCASAPPYCRACSEEANAVLAALEAAGRLTQLSGNPGQFTEAQVEAAAKALGPARRFKPWKETTNE